MSSKKVYFFPVLYFHAQWICIISDSFPMDTMIVYLIYLQSEVLNRFNISLVYQTFCVKVSSFTKRSITRIEKRFSLGKSVNREWSLKVISYHYLFKCFISSNFFFVIAVFYCFISLTEIIAGSSNWCLFIFLLADENPLSSFCSEKHL